MQFDGQPENRECSRPIFQIQNISVTRSAFRRFIHQRVVFNISAEFYGFGYAPASGYPGDSKEVERLEKATPGPSPANAKDSARALILAVI